jgi:hypothetical protein
MSSEQPSEPEAIPEDLRHLIHLNTAYWVLSCVECKEAVRPQSLVEYLKCKHRVAWEVYKRVERYVKGFGHDYTRSTIGLPDNGSAPQPLLPITNVRNSRLQCNQVFFPYKKSPCVGLAKKRGCSATGF